MKRLFIGVGILLVAASCLAQEAPRKKLRIKTDRFARMGLFLGSEPASNANETPKRTNYVQTTTHDAWLRRWRPAEWAAKEANRTNAVVVTNGLAVVKAGK